MLKESKHSIVLGRFRRHGATTMVVAFVVVLVTGLSAGGFYFWSQSDSDELKEPPLTHLVSRGPFDHIVLEQGEVESSSNVEVICEVKSRNSGTAILWVIEEGTHVKKGDLLVQLDSSVLDQELVQQKIAESTGQARVITAQSVLDQALVAKDEYLEGTFKAEEKTIESEILVAEETQSRAEETAKYSEQLAAQGFITPQQLRADQFAVKKAEVELKLAEQKLKTLQEITKRKMLIQFEADIKAAAAQLKAEQEGLNEEVSKRKEAEEQIAKCEIIAPEAGQVVHANRTSSRGSAEFVVEAGAIVRERQTIIRLPDPEQMRVTAAINEARVPLVDPGMPVTIEIGAISNTLRGTVTKVNKYAEPSTFFSSQTKEFKTFVDIIDPPKELRSGMTAEVKIFVAQMSEVIRIPVQAIMEEKGHFFSIVTHGGSDFETREIKLGPSNDKYIVIEEGVDVGERVVLNPRQYRDRMEIPDLPDPPKPAPGPKKKGKAEAEEGGPPSIGDIVERIIGANDTDEDGVLSADEIAAIEGPSAEMINGADKNGDGSVDKTELTIAFAKLRAQRAAEGGDGAGRGGPDGGGRGGGRGGPDGGGPDGGRGGGRGGPDGGGRPGGGRPDGGE